MKFRHEYKHEINQMDMIILRSRLSAVMRVDPHALDGKYEIRSLYFDTPDDKALREKIDGVNEREKFRIRLYNNDSSHISLEKKSKINGLCNKVSTPISAEEVLRIINGDIEWMKSCDRQLINELYARMSGENLKPKTIVDYTREPFVFEAGNVRVTIDYNIRTGGNSIQMLDSDVATLPTGDAIVLEVKWDEYLPDIIRKIVGMDNRRASAFSKYEQCRMYG